VDLKSFLASFSAVTLLVGSVKTIPEIIYNVSSGVLSLYSLTFPVVLLERPTSMVIVQCILRN